MIRTTLVIGALVLAAAFSGEASAQAWSHEGLTFPARENWCSTTAMQDNGQGGKTSALELRPCGDDFPFLSLAIGARSLGPIDIATNMGSVADALAGPEGERIAASIFVEQDPDCSKVSIEIIRSPVEGISGVEMVAKYACPALGAEPTVMRNFTAYAQQQNGDLWIIAFDHPKTDITEADKAMIRSAIDKIQAN